jgi:hypothetical protein
MYTAPKLEIVSLDCDRERHVIYPNAKDAGIARTGSVASERSGESQVSIENDWLVIIEVSLSCLSVA